MAKKFGLFFFLQSCLFFVLQLVWFGMCNAEEKSNREGRLTMGFYANSITELASRSDIEGSLNFWAKDFIAVESKKRLNINISESKAILFDSMDEMHSAMLRGELDMIVGPPLLIARYFKRTELEDGFTGMLSGKNTDDLLLIARKDKHIQSVKDLSGKKLMITAGDELAEMFIDSLFLKVLKKGYKNSVAAVESQKKDTRIVLDIFFNKADAGVIYRNAFEVMNELNPEIADKVIILEQFNIRSRNFSYFVKGYPYAKEFSKMAVILFNESARAKQILEVFKTPELDNCSVNELESFDKLDNDYKKLRQSINK